MLAVFHQSVASAPKELVVGSGNDSRKTAQELLQLFTDSTPDVTSISFSCGAMSYSHDNQAALKPRTFGVVDDVFCLFVGVLENLPHLRQQYGLGKNICEVTMVIEMYKALRDRAPFPADQVVSALVGHFAFVLFDGTTKTLWVANDSEGKIPFYWGVAADDSVAFSDTAAVLKANCGKSFAPFPPGCFYATDGGLRSFEHPFNALKAMPRVDSQGQFCGATFKVDQSKRNPPRGIPRVGSDAAWGAMG